MDIRDALVRIDEIRRQMAEARTFHGYRSLSTAATGLVGIVAAIAQAQLIPDPMHARGDYIILWFLAAIVSLIIVSAEIAFRSLRTDSPLERETTTLAIELFAPCLAAGFLLAYVLFHFALDSLWILPGMWAILFGLGIFASRRLLTRAATLVGAFYLLAGLACVALGQGANALSPWEMGATFGGGQLLAAGVLYFTLERRHG